MGRRHLHQVQSRGSVMHVELASDLSVVFTMQCYVLARYVLSSYVWLSITSQYCVQMAEPTIIKQNVLLLLQKISVKF